MQPTAAPINLVLFDLGRVLIRICDHWAEACTLAGVNLPLAMTEPATASQIHLLGNEFESGRITSAQYCQAASVLVNMPAGDVQKVVDAWLKGPFPGVIDLVNELHGAVKNTNIQTACLSNTNETHWQLMHEDDRHRLPLGEMNHQFASHLIGCMKPDSAIYEHVEYQTGVDPATILFFDDNEANIAAAKGRGWHAMQIDITISPEKQMRDMLKHLAILH